jgi:hypothetical protein
MSLGAGVILYTLIIGQHPFVTNEDAESGDFAAANRRSLQYVSFLLGIKPCLSLCASALICSPYCAAQIQWSLQKFEKRNR